MNSEITDQEKFWMSKFGDDYIQRNLNHKEYRKRNFTKILKKNNIEINSCIEFGSNVGINLDALKELYPELKTYGIEINKKAFEIMIKKHDGFQGSVYEFSSNKKYDLTLSAGVLIHQNPNKLESFYEKLYNFSNKYILLIEYFSPEPVALNYRGSNDKLFKRDFAGEFIDKYPDSKVIDYGFLWSRDKFSWGDDTNWFLIEKPL